MQRAEVEQYGMEPFDRFTTTSYQFVELAQGGVTGNSRVATGAPNEGIFSQKQRLAKSANNQEVVMTDARLKIPADDEYAATKGIALEGHEVLVEGRYYRIEAVDEGKDHDTGRVHFYALGLKATA